MEGAQLQNNYGGLDSPRLQMCILSSNLLLNLWVELACPEPHLATTVGQNANLREVGIIFTLVICYVLVYYRLLTPRNPFLETDSLCDHFSSSYGFIISLDITNVLWYTFV